MVARKTDDVASALGIGSAAAWTSAVAAADNTKEVVELSFDAVAPQISAEDVIVSVATADGGTDLGAALAAVGCARRVALRNER